MSLSSESPGRQEAERLGQSFLVFRDAGGQPRVYTLEDTTYRKIVVGRDMSTDVTLAWDRQVSAVHAELEQVGSDWVLLDDGLSRNGTFLNGERVQGRSRLRDGDLVRVGDTVLLYRRPLIGESEATLDASTQAQLLSDLLDRESAPETTSPPG